MADTIKANFVDYPEQKASWNGTDLIEDTSIIMGGLMDIIQYLCKILVDDYNKTETEIENDPFLDLMDIVKYKEGDEENDFANVKWCIYFVEQALEGGIVGLEEEARFIVACIYKYHQKKQFAFLKINCCQYLKIKGCYLKKIMIQISLRLI